MRLLGAIFRWILSRLFLLACIAALVVAAAIVKDWWNERRAQESQLQVLQTELGELHRTIREKRADLSLERKYLALRQREPSKWTSPLEWYRWNKEMELLAGLIDKKNAELKRLRKERDNLVQKIETSSKALYEMQQQFLSTFKKSIRTIVVLGVLILFGPLAWKAFWYFVLAPLARHASPVRIVSKSSDEGNVEVQEAKKNYPVILQPGETMLTRMAWLHQYTRTGTKRTRFLLDWRVPFLSYASGLSELTEIKIPGDGPPSEIVLSSAEDPDTYLCEVRLEQHPGLVVYPSQVIALSGNLRLTTKWVWLNLHSWISGRLRYIVFSGTGRVFLRGTGGIHAFETNGQPVRMSEPVVSAFESTLPFSTVRTETFWPYYRRLVPLFDYEFQGQGVILRQTSPHGGRAESPTLRIFDALLNAAGKLLGL